MKLEKEYRYGPSGKGRISVTKSEVRIIEDGGTVYTVAKEYVREGVPLPTGVDVFFELSWDKTRLFNITPWSGVHPAVYAGIPHRRDEEPEPLEFKPGPRRKRDGTFFSSPGGKAFNITFEITGGPFGGATVQRMFDYMFVEDEASGEAKVRGFGTSVKRLYNTLLALGTDLETEEMQYKDNILPDLDKLLAKRKQSVQLVFEEGKVRSVEQQLEAMKPKRKAKK